MNIYKKVPEQFHKQYLETLTMLSDENMQSSSSTQSRKKSKTDPWNRRIGYAGATAAAVFLTALILCAANPSLAADLPVIGPIFHALQNRLGFGQIPEEGAVVLVPDASKENATNVDASPITEQIGQTEQTAPNPYQATDSGITLSVEKYYASNQAIFLGIRMVTDEPLPYDLGDRMVFLSTEIYSFRAEDPNRGNWNYEFERIDDTTFWGIVRIDYDSIKKDLRKYTEAVQKAEEAGAQAPALSAENESQYVSYYDIPEEFDLDLEFTALRIYHLSETEGLSKESIKGSWQISRIPIRQSEEGMQTIHIDDINEKGVGLDHIELSPLEMTIYPVEPLGYMTYAVVLDKDGNVLHAGGDNCYQLAIQGHDISEITVYICDYDVYMDEIKGYTLSDDTVPLTKVLERHCLYYKTFVIK